MVPPSCSPERDLLISGGTGTRKLRSVAALIALTFAPWDCSSLALTRTIGQLSLFTFQTCTPQCAHSLNRGSECAPLNFVMASAAFRLCGHHRRRHIARTHELCNDGHLQCRLSILLIGHSPMHQTNLWSPSRECSVDLNRLGFRCGSPGASGFRGSDTTVAA